MNIKFIYDNNVNIELPANHPYSIKYKTRVDKEKQFRLISNFLIQHNYIKKNIIDLGAWIGDNSIPWAKNTKNIIYAIDPSKENCEYIQTLIKLNNINNIEVINEVICDDLRIVSTNHNLHHSKFEINDCNSIKLNAVSLDYLYNLNKIKDISYIHLDVEGMESLVIDGSKKIIEVYKPFISFEQHIETDNYKELSEKIKNKGYNVFIIDEILPECLPDCRNFLAIPFEINMFELKFKLEKDIDINILKSL